MLRYIGSLFGIVGLIWFFQGINLLPGSFMTGDIRWAVVGIISFAIGLILWSRNRPE